MAKSRKKENDNAARGGGGGMRLSGQIPLNRSKLGKAICRRFLN